MLDYIVFIKDIYPMLDSSRTAQKFIKLKLYILHNKLLKGGYFL